MARPSRQQVAGGVYHLTTRSNRSQPLYVDARDRVGFLRVLASVSRQFGWLVRLYCLMDNHYHLVVETPKPDLSAAMHRLNSAYAHWFNDVHEVEGHLFERRFRSTLVVTEGHAIQAARYIPLNPVRAGLCSRPEQYRWSSYAATIGRADRPEFLRDDWVLRMFDSDLERARELYGAFVCDGLSAIG